jgi:DNA/RNA-binding domain of Phe-tRNA-synthetase-like protein
MVAAMSTLAVRAPALEIAAFVARWPQPIGLLAPLDELAPPVPGLAGDEAVRTAVRAALRAGGYKPSGRGKPASEYLAAAAVEGSFPRINRAVDLGNRVSLATGLPISVLDLDRLVAPLAIELGAPGTRYVFNPSGQEIDASGLAILVDAHGPSGSAVKDAQRTKTHAATRKTLSVIWGVRGFEEHVRKTLAWYRELLERAGATTREVD